MAGGDQATGGRRFDLLVAALEATCGFLAAGYLVVVGVQGTVEEPGRSVVDRVGPFVLAAVVLALLLGMSCRSYRRAGRHRQSSREGDRTAGSDPATTPTLSDQGRGELTRVVALLGDAGLFAPELPDADDLEAAVADAGAVTVDTVLMALLEAHDWRPGFQADHYLAALAFHDTQVEQDRGTIQAQVEDLARLVGDHLPLRLDRVEVRRVGASDRTEIDLTLDGRQHHLDYASHPKRLSTVLHVTVARALRPPDVSADRPRLAWLWTDQGVWLAVLDRQAVLTQLNTVIGSGGELWTWVDQEGPVAAGEPLPAR